MHLDQVYAFQKQLNNLAQDNVGTPLGSAFGKLKLAVGNYLGEQVPEIGHANAGYAAAKALEEETGKLTNANDLLGYIGRAYNNVQQTGVKDSLDAAAQAVPGLGDIIQNIRAYQTAQAFTPLVRSLPQTGMGASIAHGFVREPVMAGIGAAYLTGNPLAGIAAGAGMAAKNLVTSP